MIQSVAARFFQQVWLIRPKFVVFYVMVDAKLSHLLVLCDNCGEKILVLCEKLLGVQHSQLEHMADVCSCFDVFHAYICHIWLSNSINTIFIFFLFSLFFLAGSSIRIRFFLATQKVFLKSFLSFSSLNKNNNKNKKKLFLIVPEPNLCFVDVYLDSCFSLV